MDLDTIMQTGQVFVAQWGIKVVGAIAVLIVGWIVAKMIRGMVRKALSKRLDETLVPFLSNLVYWGVLAGVIIAVLDLFGIETTSFVAVLGALGFAVGLAMQGTLSNFSAGVMLLIFRPFKVGDFIEAAGTSGKVIEIGIFSTTLHSGDNVKIIVPNSSVYGTIVKNYSANDTRRNDLVMGISYDDDIAKAMDVIKRVLDADDRVLRDPEPTIAVGELADSSVNILVRPWCNAADYWALRFDLLRTLKQELEGAGCSIPYPQSDVHMHQVSGGAA